MIARCHWISFAFSSETVNCHKCSLHRHRLNSVYSLQLYITKEEADVVNMSLASSWIFIHIDELS